MSSDFEQQLLLPPSAVEIRIRLGFVPERDHAQVMVECFEPATRAVLAQWSRHAFRMSFWPDALEQAVEKANAFAAQYVEPF